MNRRRVMNPWESPSRVSADSGTLDVPTRIGSITQPERRRHVFDDPFGDPFGDPFVGVSPRSSGPVRPLDTQPQPITPPAAIMTPSTDVTALSGITRDSTGVFHGPPPPDDEPIVADSEPEAEHQETVNKAAALAKAVQVAETAF